VRLRLLSGLPEHIGPSMDSDAPLEAAEEGGGALERGTLLHRAFEIDAFAAPDPEAVVRRLASAARMNDLASVRKVVLQVKAFAGSVLCERLSRARKSFAELPFVLVQEDLELSGTIDRLV